MTPRSRIVLTVAAACAWMMVSAHQPAAAKPYAFTLYGGCISVPDSGWIVEVHDSDTPSEVSVILVNMDNKALTKHIALIAYPVPTALDVERDRDLWYSRFIKARRAEPGVTLLDSGEVLLGGRKALRITYVMPVNGRPRLMTSYMILARPYAHELALRSDVDSVEADPELGPALASFRLCGASLSPQTSDPSFVEFLNDLIMTPSGQGRLTAYGFMFALVVVIITTLQKRSAKRRKSTDG